MKNYYQYNQLSRKYNCQKSDQSINYLTLPIIDKLLNFIFTFTFIIFLFISQIFTYSRIPFVFF